MGIPPPWNNILYGLNKTTLKTPAASFGVRGLMGTYHFENVTVIGVIRRKIYENFGREITSYYLDAVEIHRLDKEA